ncbi:MAG: class I SAM-dependent methyltransferase [Planctomycetota bacterium]
MCWRSLSLALLVLLIAPMTVPPAVGQQRKKPDRKRPPQRQEQPENRTESLRAICKRIDVGAGSVIADIGAGQGRDSWAFADIVGESGKVFAEEIEKSKTKSLKKEAEKRSLEQVEPVLGTTTSPKLPANSVDMAFMHYVYHHVTKPREMLRHIWKSLKPGGHLVVVDRELGTLTNWVPREDRGAKHYWIAETTVVREARETGFSFVEYADSAWHKKGTFVLVFQRPTALSAPNRDPDPLPAIPDNTVSRLLPPDGQNDQRVAFVALGEGRELIRPLLEATACEAVDVVLEEWATRKDERPPLPEGIKLPSVFTEQGDPNLSSEPIDAVYFLDTYHLLFHAPVLLEHLRERLTDDGKVYILDRAADQKMSHRESSHRRMIHPELVTQEMQAARFVPSRDVAQLGEDRFLMVFEKSE